MTTKLSFLAWIGLAYDGRVDVWDHCISLLRRMYRDHEEFALIHTNHFQIMDKLTLWARFSLALLVKLVERNEKVRDRQERKSRRFLECQAEQYLTWVDIWIDQFPRPEGPYHVHKKISNKTLDFLRSEFLDYGKEFIATSSDDGRRSTDTPRSERTSWSSDYGSEFDFD